MGYTAMYLRKSQPKELGDTVEETLQRQKATLLEFAQKNNITISEIYEEVVSGDSLYARPEMLRLLSDIEAGKYSFVLCSDIDRLGRGAMSEQGIILETFKSAGVKIITPRKVYDLSNDIDEEYTEFETFIARRELKLIKRRMRRGIERTIEDGGYIANAPYGYRKTTVRKSPTLEIYEEEARFVRLMFDLYANQGYGCQHIADTINAMGAKPHRSSSFGRTSVMKILRNPVYIGKIVWNQKKHLRTAGKDGVKHSVLYNPPEKWTIVDGLHPPIVDEDLFRKTQEIFKGRYHPPSFTGSVENPLAGLVVCANCGGLMQRQAMPKSKEAYLICLRRGCIVSSMLPFVEQAVLAELRRLSNSLRSEADHQEIDSPTEDYSAALNALDEEQEKIRVQLDRLSDLLEQGVYTIERYQEREKILYEKREKIEASRKRILEKPIPRQLDKLAMSNRIDKSLEEYPDLSLARKNQLLKSIVEKVTYYKEKGWKPHEFEIQIDLLPIYR